MIAVPDHPMWLRVIRTLQQKYQDGVTDFSPQRLRESFIDDMHAEGMNEKAIIKEIDAGRLNEPIQNCLKSLEAMKAVSAEWVRDDDRIRVSIFGNIMLLNLPADTVPNVTIQMLMDHAGCSRQKILNAMEGHELTKERRGKPDWFVYSELRPLLPKDYQWPLSPPRPKRKTAKNSK